MALHLSQNREADALISDDPMALLIGMVLDQQVPLEWAFAAPLELKRRLGRPLDPARIAAMDPEALASMFSAKPALHRYPGSMAARVHEVARVVTDRYRGSAADIWSTATSGRELFDRVRELPGFGEQKAKIFVALLGKQLRVRPGGWEEVSTPYSDPGSTRSVADITGPDSLAQVRTFKAALKAAKKSGAAATKARASKARAPKAATTKAGTSKTTAAKAPGSRTTAGTPARATRSASKSPVRARGPHR